MSLADVLRSSYLKKTQSVSIDLAAIISKRLAHREMDKPWSGDAVIRVSSVIRMCPRQEVLRYRLGIPRGENITSTLQCTFDFGNAFHHLVQNKWLGQWGLLIGDWRCANCGTLVKNRKIPEKCFICSHDKFLYEEMAPVNLEYGISGHPDGVIEVGGYRGVLELKTYNGKFFSHVKRYRKPFPSHIDQAQMYMWLTGEKFAVILYFDKEMSEMVSFSIEYSADHVEKFLRRVRQFRDAMATEQLPKRELCETRTCSRAVACLVRKECFSRE